MTVTFNKNFKSTLFLALPILFSHIIEGLVPFINTCVAGQMSYTTLAAIGLGNTIFFSFMGFAWGSITSVAILCSHKLGEKNELETSKILYSGWIMSFIISLPLIILFLNFEPILVFFNQDVEVANQCQIYFYGLAIAVLPDLAKSALFQFLITKNRVKIILIVNIFSILFLLLFECIFIWGYLTVIPPLGIWGIGISSALTYWVVFIGLIFYFFLDKSLTPYRSLKFSYKEIKNYLIELFKLGTPIGLMFTIEITFFMIISLLMGQLGTETLAAHQIAFQWLGITILVAFGFAQAVTVLVSKASGAVDKVTAKQVTITGILMSTFFTFIIALTYWFFPHLIVSMDLDISDPLNNEISNLAITFLSIVALFQILDSFRIVTSAALRGMKETQFPMWIAIVTFWLLGLPFGYCLAFNLHWGGVGLWCGILLSLIINLYLQINRLRRYLF